MHQSMADEQLYQSRDDVAPSAMRWGGSPDLAWFNRHCCDPAGSSSGCRGTRMLRHSRSPRAPVRWICRAAADGTVLAAAPNGHQSDLTRGIAESVAGRDVCAVVLFSDGRQVGGDPTVAWGLTPGAVPVFTISAAASSPPHDLAFANVRAPSSVFAGQSFGVHVELRHDGIKGDISVHLAAPDQPEQILKAPIREGRRMATADFRVKLSQAGAQKLRLSFPKAEGEASDANNHVDRWIKVVPRRMKVLLVAGSPSWDFQFVQQCAGTLAGNRSKCVAAERGGQVVAGGE